MGRSSRCHSNGNSAELEQAVDSAEPDSAPQPFHVFRKDNQRRSMTYVDHVGTINATSAHAALKAAREEIRRRRFVWWIVPDSAVIASDDVPVESWFAPALEKHIAISQHTALSIRSDKCDDVANP